MCQDPPRYMMTYGILVIGQNRQFQFARPDIHLFLDVVKISDMFLSSPAMLPIVDVPIRIGVHAVDTIRWSFK